VWSVRSSNLDLGRYDWTHRLGYRIERALANLPDLIIANSNAGRNFAAARGFPARRITVIANGINTDRFRPNASFRAKQRRAWRIGNDTILVGCLARLDPMKDHPTFIRAGALVADSRENIRLVCVGNGPELGRLRALAVELGLEGRILFAGNADAAMALNAFDIACSSSFTEGFPNGVAEAMACGRPCVVTDAGDSARIVGEFGTVVRSRDPEALARGISREIELRSQARSAAARQRIVDQFSVDRMVDGTIAALWKVTHRQRRGTRDSTACAE
jgi:glycosyltransferase involved in cell wall biosynthesis